MVAVKKTTVLEGYCASGDCECFCFDKRLREELISAQCNSYEEEAEMNERCRKYPTDFLPETDGKKGRWVITVEFVPED